MWNSKDIPSDWLVTKQTQTLTQLLIQYFFFFLHLGSHAWRNHFFQAISDNLRYPQKNLSKTRRLSCRRCKQSQCQHSAWLPTPHLLLTYCWHRRKNLSFVFSMKLVYIQSDIIKMNESCSKFLKFSKCLYSVNDSNYVFNKIGKFKISEIKQIFWYLNQFQRNIMVSTGNKTAPQTCKLINLFLSRSLNRSLSPPY